MNLIDDSLSPLGNSSNSRWRPTWPLYNLKSDRTLYNHHFTARLESQRCNIPYAVPFGSLVCSLSPVFRVKGIQYCF